MSTNDCQHEWADISIDQSGKDNVFTCLKCGQRLEADPRTAAVIQAEELVVPIESIPPELVGTDPASPGSIAWKYESTYYHIYGRTPSVDDIFDPIFIGIPRSESADIDVQNIVDALNRIVSRKDLEG
jgi:hypothetical protein